jgi:hypothetical protein
MHPQSQLRERRFFWIDRKQTVQQAIEQVDIFEASSD